MANDTQRKIDGYNRACRDFKISGNFTRFHWKVIATNIAHKLGLTYDELMSGKALKKNVIVKPKPPPKPKRTQPDHAWESGDDALVEFPNATLRVKVLRVSGHQCLVMGDRLPANTWVQASNMFKE